MRPVIQNWPQTDSDEFLRLLRKYIAGVEEHREEMIAILSDSDAVRRGERPRRRTRDRRTDHCADTPRAHRRQHRCIRQLGPPTAGMQHRRPEARGSSMHRDAQGIRRRCPADTRQRSPARDVDRSPPSRRRGDPAIPPWFTHAQIRTILLGLMAGMLLAALDQTIVATSIRTIADDLNGLSAQAWVTTAYLITSTVTTPLYGKLSDIYGRRPLFITAISIFIVGSLACTLATSMYELAAFRALQGIGAGGLFSMALAILADIVPPRERARYQGYFLAVFGMSSVDRPARRRLLRRRRRRSSASPAGAGSSW